MDNQLEKQRSNGGLFMMIGTICAFGFAIFFGLALSDTNFAKSNLSFMHAGILAILFCGILLSSLAVFHGIMLIHAAAIGKIKK